MDRTQNSAARIREFLQTDLGQSAQERWCRLIVYACYAATAISAAVLIAVWVFWERGYDKTSNAVYWWRYILLPCLTMLLFTAGAHLLLRSDRFTLIIKEYAALLLITLQCVLLCFIHSNAAVLLATFMTPVFISAIFADLKITRHIFFISFFGLLLSGLKMGYFSSRSFERWIWIELGVAVGILFASYALAKIIIRFGQFHIDSYMSSCDDQKQLREQLMRDPSTGLYNRRAFDEMLPELINRCKSDRICLSMAIIDLDHFKSINDEFGHPAGDSVLRRFAHILNGYGNENILAFRVGGEEFILLLKDICVYNAYKLLEGMRAIMDAAAVPEVRSKRVSFSCGLSCTGGNRADAVTLFQTADEALYLAKNSGKGMSIISDNHHASALTGKLQHK